MILPNTNELLDLNFTIAKDLFEGTQSPIEVLPKIKNFIYELSKTLPADEYEEKEEGVFIANDAKISPLCTIMPPTIIGHKAEVRPGAFIRGSVIVGEGAVIGNSTEVKNAIIFDGVQLPHYNYVGDSILGHLAHLGAGAIISNFKLDHGNINVRSGSEVYHTGLRKFGAIIGDNTEVGCNSVIYPGTVMGKRCMVYPLTPVRGVIPDDTIVKPDGTLVDKSGSSK